MVLKVGLIEIAMNFQLRLEAHSLLPLGEKRDNWASTGKGISPQMSNLWTFPDISVPITV